MHWLLILAVLNSTTSLKNGGTATQLNKLAENALRQKLGVKSGVTVNIAPGKGRGDFDSMSVSLDGFSADRLMDLAGKTGSTGDAQNAGDDPYGDYGNAGGDGEDNGGEIYPPQFGPRNLKARNFGVEDILNGGKIGDIGNILGGIFGSSKGGRIGRLKLNATNFSFGGARYDTMRADLGEIRFDWTKALRGEFDVKSVAPGNLFVGLRGDQAAKLLAPRLPSLRNLRVRFDGGRAFVAARANYLGVNVPFEVGGRLSVTQNQVRADEFQASVARLRLPGFVLNEITRGVNPLYDFDPQKRWPIAVNLQTAGTTNNVMSMRGGIQWLSLNRKKETPADSSNRYPDARDDSQDSQPAPKNGDVLGDILGGVFGR